MFILFCRAILTSSVYRKYLIVCVNIMNVWRNRLRHLVSETTLLRRIHLECFLGEYRETCLSPFTFLLFSFIKFKWQQIREEERKMKREKLTRHTVKKVTQAQIARMFELVFAILYHCLGSEIFSRKAQVSAVLTWGQMGQPGW